MFHARDIEVNVTGCDPFKLTVILTAREALAAWRPAGYNLRVETTARAIQVKVLFFGRLKELVGRAEEVADVAAGAPIEELFAQYSSRNPELASYRGSLVASCNQEFAAWDTPLRAGDEVAFLPPVSGG